MLGSHNREFMFDAKRVISFFLITWLLFLSSVTPALAAVTYTYDANGNMLSDGSSCYSYNEANLLSKVKVCSSGQLIAEYVYDGSGNRVIKKVYEYGTLSKTIYSPDKEYETVKLPSGTMENTTYVYANDELLARKNSDGSKTFYHNDHLGSVSLLTDQSGAVLENTKYLPYGDILSGGTKSKYLFTGQEKDKETGLNYYGARYYNSHMQRFIQPDSVLPDLYDPQGLNRYSYVRNNPLKYTDPSGHWWFIPPLIDYGWTGYDLAQQQAIIWDVNSTSEERQAARKEQEFILGAEITAIMATQGVDSVFPGDDIARKGIKAIGQSEAKNVLEHAGGKGFSSSSKLFKFIGACHKPDACHHIVEQHADNLFRFGNEQIQNTLNIIKLPDSAGEIHRKITGFYNQSAKAVFPNAVEGQRVRDVVKQWDYVKQYNYGIDVINQFGGEKYLKDAGIKKL